MPRCAIVIPTYNRVEDLRKCLDALERQTLKDFRVVVIDNGSTDGTAELLKARAVDIVVDTRKHLGHIFQRAWMDNPEELTAYLNDDSEPTDEWFEHAARTLDDPTVAAVGGPTAATRDQEMYALRERGRRSLLLRPAAFIFERYLAEGKLMEPGLILRSGAISIGGSLRASGDLPEPRDVNCLSFTNLVIRRRALETLGGLDTNMIWSQIDGDLFLRMEKAGMRMVFHPRVFVWHHVNPAGATRKAYPLARDFGYFAAKHLLTRGWRDQLRVRTYLVFYNLFWVQQAIATRTRAPLQGLKGYRDGKRAFRAARRAGTAP